MNANDFYINNIRTEVENLFESIFAEIELNTEAQRLYNGWQVWFSKIIDNPEILFIGNNPNNVQNDPDFDPHENFDYITDERNWELKDSTIELFKDKSLAKYFDSEKCVKTNYYYIGTSSARNLEKLRGELEKSEKGKILVRDFNRKSKEWTTQIIKKLNPKIIICEGVESFHLVTEHVFQSKLNRNKENGIFKYYPIGSSVKIIGYKRKRSSGIKNLELLKDVLKKEMQIDQE